MGCGVWVEGCVVWSEGRGVWGVGCGVWGVGCGVWGVGCRVRGVGPLACFAKHALAGVDIADAPANDKVDQLIN